MLRPNIEVENLEEYIIIDKNYKSIDNEKVAGFDLDHTLIKPKSGKTFYKTEDVEDWIFYNELVPDKLLELHNSGYKILIISNQGALKTKDNINVWINRIKSMISSISTIIPIKIIGITSKDVKYRKPLPYMWNNFVSGYNPESFYCGDAAGLDKRSIKGIKLPKDFADTDAKFALNCGVRFLNRDDYIISDTLTFNNYKIKYPDIKMDITLDKKQFIFKQKTLIIMVGFPGSGKSTFIKKYLPHMTRINNDTMKKKQIDTLLKESLENGKSIVIDNTNPSAIARSTFIKVTQPYNYTIVAIHIQTDKDLSMHNNMYRSLTEGVTKVPSIVYNIYKKKFVLPAEEEGFNNIMKIKSNGIKNSDSRYYYYYF